MSNVFKDFTANVNSEFGNYFKFDLDLSRDHALKVIFSLVTLKSATEDIATTLKQLSHSISIRNKKRFGEF